MEKCRFLRDLLIRIFSGFESSISIDLFQSLNFVFLACL